MTLVGVVGVVLCVASPSVVKSHVLAGLIVLFVVFAGVVFYVG
jgi:uncharacterized membrane protein (GlpM family)